MISDFPPVNSSATTAVVGSPAPAKLLKYKTRKLDDWAPKNKIGVLGRRREDLIFKEMDLGHHLLQSKMHGLKA